MMEDRKKKSMERDRGCERKESIEDEKEDQSLERKEWERKKMKDGKGRRKVRMVKKEWKIEAWEDQGW